MSNVSITRLLLNNSITSRSFNELRLSTYFSVHVRLYSLVRDPWPVITGTPGIPSDKHVDYVMGKSKKFKITKGGTGNSDDKKSSSKPTHFICFPLARTSTVPEFAKSMSYFRDISTEPRRQPLIRKRNDELDRADLNLGNGPLVPAATEFQQNEHSLTEVADPLGNVSKSLSANPGFEESLKILPSIVYRGPGTMHLTLGVMDLSDPAEMQRAQNLLRDLDLPQILKNAEKGPPTSMKSARKWQDTPEVDSKESMKGESEAKQTVDTNTEDAESSINSRPLSISLTGISAFASAKKARVIWAKPRAQSAPNIDEIPRMTGGRPNFSPSEQERLYNFALHLHYAFKDAGLVNETRTPVLHATIANMRYKMQAKGGRTSKGRAWTHGKKRWEDGLVDARVLARVFNEFDGDVVEAKMIIDTIDSTNTHSDDDAGSDHNSDNSSEKKKSVEAPQSDTWDQEVGDPNKEFIFKFFPRRFFL